MNALFFCACQLVYKAERIESRPAVTPIEAAPLKVYIQLAMTGLISHILFPSYEH
jgi:hypothetical protein